MGYARGYTDGYTEKNTSASINYTYHTHTGNSSTKGGCYTAAVTCGGELEPRANSLSCYNGSSNTWGNCFRNNNNVKCSTHGCHYDSEDAIARCHCPSTWYCMKCGTNYGEFTGSYSLDYKRCSAIIGYSVSCGKTTETIESATIVF